MGAGTRGLERARGFDAFGAIVIALMVVLGIAGLARGDEVRLRASVVVDADRPVRVSDVATIRGDEAFRGADAVVAASVGDLDVDQAGVARVTMERVRSTLADAGVMTARVAFSGASCVVRVRGAAAPAAEPAPEPAPAARTFEEFDPASPLTVRRRVVEWIARTYAVESADVRVLFDPRDEPLLATEEGPNTVIVRPTTTSSSARPVMDVRVIAGERTVASGMVSAEVEIRQQVMVAAGEIDRHLEVSPDLVREDVRWMAPEGSQVVRTIGAVMGQRAARRIRAGEVLRETDLEGIIAVKRGEVVLVECVRGGISIQTKARAMGDGRIGDRIECRLETSRKSFVGTVDAVGRVVVALGDTVE